MFEADIVVVGGGIAGATIARELSASASVILLEREAQVGYHSTGRSAAAYIPSYDWDNAALRLLTLCSYSLFESPPAAFQCPELLHRRGLLTLLPPDDPSQYDARHRHLQLAIPSIRRLTHEQTLACIPDLCEDYAQGAWFEPDVFDIDVDALQQGYLRDFRARGGRLLTGAEVTAVHRAGGLWEIATSAGAFKAPIVVNAAGAWADGLAAMAGVQAIGLEPRRRTAILVSPRQGSDVSRWPVAMCADGSFYFKPDAGQLLVSPADEHLSPPCDAQPEELDIAYAVQIAQDVLALDVHQVRHRWAGLRNFVADRTPVVGFDENTEGFFWLAGQGGHGIQTAPATARLAAGLILNNKVPSDLEQAGFDPTWVSPRRLQTTSARTTQAH